MNADAALETSDASNPKTYSQLHNEIIELSIKRDKAFQNAGPDEAAEYIRQINRLENQIRWLSPPPPTLGDRISKCTEECLISVFCCPCLLWAELFLREPN